VSLSKYESKDYSKQALANTYVIDNVRDRMNSINIFSLQPNFPLYSRLNTPVVHGHVMSGISLPNIYTSVRMSGKWVNVAYQPKTFYLVPWQKTDSSLKLYESIIENRVNYILFNGSAFPVYILNELTQVLDGIEVLTNVRKEIGDSVILFIPEFPTYSEVFGEERVPPGIMKSNRLYPVTFMGNFSPASDLVKNSLELNKVLHVVGYRV
jgi:hypothetical protein